MEFDIDSENSEDSYMCPEYAKDIFDYLKQREVSQTSTPTGYPRGWELFLYGDKFGEFILLLSAGEVCPLQLHAHTAQPQHGDEGDPDRLAR